ncbi:PREDICTED: taste receptor type 2 member 10-like [Bison bison bison]|uniref:Taste receptor type 2 n=1 Tax=Bison bison bison TaxID=43346 RepID=A0A6P3IXG3_BISBB|nr:PREDICTED: taste receptor type 2 member 10-like [Bison bison bison]
MLSVLEGLLIFVAVSESILGVLGDGFIGLAYFIECVKNKKFSTISFILMGLATSRICLIGLITTDGFVKIFSPEMYSSGYLIDCITYSWVILNPASVFFATSLSIFYFLKIANFSHHIFLWLRSDIKRVLLLLMGYLLISWLVTFPLTMKIISDSRAKNRSVVFSVEVHKGEFFRNQILLNLGTLTIFILCLITCILLLISLRRHNQRMLLNATGFRDPSTEAHIKAMKVLISFIILFILYFIGITIEISCTTMSESKLLFIFGLTITALYPWGHSFILILGNNKLKQVFLRVQKQLKCWKKEKLLRTP